MPRAKIPNRNGNLGEVFYKMAKAVEDGEAKATAVTKYVDHSSWNTAGRGWADHSRYEITVLGPGFQCDLKVDAA